VTKTIFYDAEIITCIKRFMMQAAEGDILIKPFLGVHFIYSIVFYKLDHFITKHNFRCNEMDKFTKARLNIFCY
jgi:hypothetical protein